jgi:hypothetical protein
MNKVIFLVIFLVILLGAAWIYHSSSALFEEVMVISEFKQTAKPSGLYIVDMKEKKFEFKEAKGFLSILKTLWPIWGTIFFLTLIVIPFSYWISVSLRKAEIKKMEDKVNKIESESKAEIRKSKTEQAEYQAKAKQWAEDYAQNARNTARKELESEFDSLHQQERSLIERENSVAQREIDIAQKERSAQDQVLHIQELYKDELDRFEREIAQAEKSKKNAIATMRRRATKGHTKA